MECQRLRNRKPCMSLGFCYQTLITLLRQYATEDSFSAAGAHVLRPWMLPHRADFGLRGSCDVETWYLLKTMLKHVETLVTWNNPLYGIHRVLHAALCFHTLRMCRNASASWSAWTGSSRTRTHQELKSWWFAAWMIDGWPVRSWTCHVNLSLEPMISCHHRMSSWWKGSIVLHAPYLSWWQPTNCPRWWRLGTLICLSDVLLSQSLLVLDGAGTYEGAPSLVL